MLPILLIHGFPFDGTLWLHQTQFLRSPAGGSLTVIAPDLPGFGPDPAPPPAPATIDAYAQALQAVMLQHGGGRFIVGGLSMGGYILLALLRAFPSHIAAAMLIDTRAEADTPEARANRLQSIDDIRAAQREGAGPGSTAKLIDTMLPRLLGQNTPPAVQQSLRTMMARQSPAAIIAAQAAMAARRDHTDFLPHIEVPTLIVVGDQDVSTPPAVAHAMRDKIPNSQLVEIPNAGHMTPLEAPDALNSAIRDFAMTIR